MHKAFFVILSVLFFLPSKAAMKMALDGGFLSIETIIDGSHIIRYEFSRCMANHLFTFSRVLVDGAVVNEATSDNIGPFLIDGSGWTGGNHLLPDGSQSARTDSVSIMCDGNRCLNGKFFGDADVVTIRVVNTLLDPSDPSRRFCTETVRYTVCGNSIQVSATHNYLNRQPLTVARYYGMQSMTVGETEILTPGGK